MLLLQQFPLLVVVHVVVVVDSFIRSSAFDVDSPPSLAFPLLRLRLALTLVQFI